MSQLGVLTYQDGRTYEPDSHVRGDLIVSTTASMQLASNVFTDNLAQASFVGSMDILVIRLNLELHPGQRSLTSHTMPLNWRTCLAVGPFLLDLLETSGNLLLFVLYQDTRLEQSF